MSTAKRLHQAMYKLMQHAEHIDQINTYGQDVTVTQSYTLLALPAEGDISMRDLIGQMDISNSAMTRMADQLIKRGLIQRETDSDDRRVVRVHLTEEGQELQQQIKTDYQEFFGLVLAEIPPDEHIAIIEALEKVISVSAKVMKEQYGE